MGFSWKRWRWVGLFLTVTALSYIHVSKEKKEALQKLSLRMEEMEREKGDALAQREELSLKLASQGDPAWIELVLMRELGVVPEGWLKVHFRK